MKLNRILASFLFLSVIFAVVNVSFAADNGNIYVSTQGNDYWNGQYATWQNGINGPKKTITDAVTCVDDKGTVNVANGQYKEHLVINKNMNLVGQSQSGTIIDGTGTGTVITINQAITVNISNLSIQNGNTASNGGGIYNSGTCVITNCMVQSNTAYDGGGIYSSGSLTVKDSIMQKNNANGGGGALFVNVGDCNISNTDIKDNTGYDCGGGVNIVNGICSMNGGCVSYNTASTDMGGGIYNTGSLTVNNCNIQYNQAKGYNAHGGGGISNKGTLTVNNCDITGNTLISNAYGGGIYNEGGTLNVNGGIIQYNNAWNGGGIHNAGGTCTIDNCIIQYNTLKYTKNYPNDLPSYLYGGGIHSNGGTCTITNSTIQGNKADDYGAGIYNYACTLTVTNCNIIGNIAGYYGGGILSRHTCTITNCTIKNNQAAMYGGGIYTTGSLTVKDCNITYNHASDGAGIYSLGILSIDKNSVINNNVRGDVWPARPSSGLGGSNNNNSDPNGNSTNLDPDLNSVNTGANSNQSSARNTQINALTVPMQKTGIPVTGLILSVLMVLGGLYCGRR